jgi:hypothetical protein
MLDDECDRSANVLNRLLKNNHENERVVKKVDKAQAENLIKEIKKYSHI